MLVPLNVHILDLAVNYAAYFVHNGSEAWHNTTVWTVLVWIWLQVQHKYFLETLRHPINLGSNTGRGKNFVFFKTYRLVLRLSQHSFQWVPGAFCGQSEARHHSYLEPDVGITRAAPKFLHIPSWHMNGQCTCTAITAAYPLITMQPEQLGCIALKPEKSGGGGSCGSKCCNLHSWCVARQRWWPWEWNAVLIVPAWLLVACTGVGSAM